MFQLPMQGYFDLLPDPETRRPHRDYRRIRVPERSSEVAGRQFHAFPAPPDAEHPSLSEGRGGRERFAGIARFDRVRGLHVHFRFLGKLSGS